jgi:ubiquinol-cytochrome c reductase iron-sulfur subunit
VKLGNFNRRTFAQQQQRFFSTSPVSQSQTTQVPDFSKYKSGDGRSTYYMLLGTTGFVGAVSAKNFVVDFIQQLAPGADVLALAKAEVDLAGIPEGEFVL